MDKRRMWRRYWGIFTTIVVGIILFFAIFLVAFRILGYELYTVMSGSMEPEYHVGSLIYVKPVDVNTLKAGDVITFVADENKTVVTHRIVSVVEGENELHFKTKGDANDVEDGRPVHHKNVLGVPSFSIPLLGYLAFYIQRPPGLYIALVVGTLLLAAIISPIFNRGKEKAASKSKK